MAVGAADAILWGSAIGAYGVGDTMTTRKIIENEGTAELNPFIRAVVERYGTPGLVAYKASILAALMGVYAIAPPDLETVVPGTATAVGGATTFINSALLEVTA